MAQSIKCLYNLRDSLSKNLLFVMNNYLEISHLKYPAVLSSTVDNNLIVILEKQLSCAGKACYHCWKFESSTDKKLQQKILLIRRLLDHRITSISFS